MNNGDNKMIDLKTTELLNEEAKKYWATLRPALRKKINRDTDLINASRNAIAAIGLSQMEAAQDIAGYDRYIVAFSGGKDSLACLLWLLDQGIDHDKIELHHHDVDGREGSTAFDWAVTKSYCEAVAKNFDLPLTYSWRMGGIEGEILKTDAPSQGMKYTTLGGEVVELATHAKVGTRQKFPAITADLRTRWCSSLVKIDVFSRWMNSEARFEGKKILVITGERAQESSNRASYNYAEAHKTNSGKKTVHAIRPILNWSEAKVWETIKASGIKAHPAYHLGFSRVSCATCIFNGRDEFATIRKINPAQFSHLANIEGEINFTMKNGEGLASFADKGTALEAPQDVVDSLLAANYSQAIKVAPGASWNLPAGAYKGGSCGSV